MSILQPQIVSLLNAQVAREQNSFQQYKAAGMWARRAGYHYAYKYLHGEAKDELHHRNRILAYLNDFGEQAILPSTPPPMMQYGSLSDCFAAMLDLEVDNTRALTEIIIAARDSGDELTVRFMHKYMKWQRQAYDELLEIRQLFVEFGSDAATLIDIDERIGKV